MEFSFQKLVEIFNFDLQKQTFWNMRIYQTILNKCFDHEDANLLKLNRDKKSQTEQPNSTTESKLIRQDGQIYAAKTITIATEKN